mgnify:CR=1 FL=1
MKTDIQQQKNSNDIHLAITIVSLAMITFLLNLFLVLSI